MTNTQCQSVAIDLRHLTPAQVEFASPRYHPIVTFPPSSSLLSFTPLHRSPVYHLRFPSLLFHLDLRSFALPSPPVPVFELPLRSFHPLVISPPLISTNSRPRSSPRSTQSRFRTLDLAYIASPFTDYRTPLPRCITTTMTRMHRAPDRKRCHHLVRSSRHTTRDAQICSMISWRNSKP